MNFCKYKLLHTKRGYVNPDDITNSGFVLKTGTNCSDMVFIGECEYKKGDILPKHILSIHSEKEINKIKKDKDKDKLKEYKQEKYKQFCDPLFIEAIREKMTGNETKWNNYIKICKKVKGIKEVGG